jgi:hypothetical protein
MANLNLTLENQAKTLRATIDLTSELRPRERGDGFYLSATGSIELKGDRRLHATVQVRPNRAARVIRSLPTGMLARSDEGPLSYKVENDRLDIWADLQRTLFDGQGRPAVLCPSGKHGFNYSFTGPVKEGRMSFYVSLLVYFSNWSPSLAKTSREYDLLPFLAGGQWESNRRKH